MKLEKIVVVKKETSLEELLARHATTSQVKFYLESRGESYEFYRAAQLDYQAGLEETLKGISSSVRSQVIDRKYLPTFQFGNKDLVVVVGDPGLVVNVAKYVGEQPIISVNPDPARFEGIFSACTPKGFPAKLRETLDNKVRIERLTMAEACLDDGQIMYAINDLFIGRDSHVSARYTIEYEGEKEMHSSSGIIVSTGTGSTGWLTSIMIGAHSIAGQNYSAAEARFPRDSDYLIFAVREPFPSKITGADIVYGEITRDSPLRIVSRMPERGVIFSDGIESDYLEFNAGRSAIIRPSEKGVNLVR